MCVIFTFILFILFNFTLFIYLFFYFFYFFVATNRILITLETETESEILSLYIYIKKIYSTIPAMEGPNKANAFKAPLIKSLRTAELGWANFGVGVEDVRENIL